MKTTISNLELSWLRAMASIAGSVDPAEIGRVISGTVSRNDLLHLGYSPMCSDGSTPTILHAAPAAIH